VRRLVAGAAARNDGDLSLVPVLSNHDLDVRMAIEPGEAFSAGAREQAVDRFVDHGFAGIQESSHV
jgi:hypothetical protein